MVLSVLIITNNVCIFLYVETLFDPHYKYYAMAGFGILLAPFFVGFYLSRIADIAPSIKVSAVVCPLTIVAIVLAFDIL